MFCLAIFVFFLLKGNNFKVPGDRFLWLIADHIIFESMRADSIYIGFVKINELVSMLVLVFVLLLFSIRAIKKRGFRLTDPAKYILTIASIVVAFLMEFYMGQATYLRNTSMLAISVLVIMIISIRFYISIYKDII